MSHLIPGGTGAVEGVVVRALSGGGEEIRVVSRSRQKLRDPPDSAGRVGADRTDPTTFEGAFRESEALFLLNPVPRTEQRVGLFAPEEAAPWS